MSQTCSPEQLEQVLTTYSYSDEELIHAAKHMLREFRSQSQLWLSPHAHWQQLCQRLLLLEHGAAADEHLWGNLSVLCTHWTEEETRIYLPINPLLAT